MKKNSVYIRVNNYCFAPTLLPSLMVILLLPLLVYLGFWQIHRGDTKNQIQKVFCQRSVSTPIDLNQAKHIDLEKNYFPGIMQGHFDNQHTFLLENKIYLHQVGYEILTPFILNDRQETILVNRGWIPQGRNRKKIPKIYSQQLDFCQGAARMSNRSVCNIHEDCELSGNTDKNSSAKNITSWDNELTIHGLTVFPNKTFSFKQANKSGWPKRILAINPDFLKKNNFQPFILIINAKQLYSFTPLWQPISLQASRHYAYAFQWFSLGLILFIAFFTTHIRRL